MYLDKTIILTVMLTSDDIPVQSIQHLDDYQDRQCHCHRLTIEEDSAVDAFKDL